MAYNFGSAILRAVGDTKRPLYFLTLAGVVNIVLNLFFVIQLHMDVAGVALATVLSQCVSAGLVLKCLAQSDGPLKLHLKKLRIDKRKTLLIMKIGLPAGMQGAIFSISNVLIQSSVNSFGSIAMAGNTASANIEGFVYTAMNALYQTNLSFTSQNIGARMYTRVNRILFICLGTVTAVGMALGFLAVIGGNGSSENLFFGSGSDFLWNAPDVHYLHDLFYLRLDGYAGGQSQGDGIFRPSHGGIPDRSLRTACDMDFYHFCLPPYAFFIIYIVSDFVAHYGGRSHDLLSQNI